MEAFVTEKSKDYCLLDKHTGELLEYRQTRKISVEDFMMVFFNSSADMYRLSNMQKNVLMCCWKFSSFNDKRCNSGNLITNNRLFKDSCKADGLATSDAVIDNAISRLTKCGFLIKKCKGTYLLNPKYFFKGTLSDKTKIQYSLMVEPEEKETDKQLKEITKELAEIKAKE